MSKMLIFFLKFQFLYRWDHLLIDILLSNTIAIESGNIYFILLFPNILLINKLYILKTCIYIFMRMYNILHYTNV